MASTVVSSQTSLQQVALSTASAAAAGSSEASLEFSAVLAFGELLLPASGIAIGADATAVGTNTLAALEIEASAGPASTSGSVALLAMSDGAAGSATTSATLELLGDAQQALFFSAVGQTQQTTVQAPGLALSTASSSFTVAVVFVPGLGTPDTDDSFGLPGEPIPSMPDGPSPAVSSFTIDDGPLLGNTAVFVVDASAIGDDSFVDLQLTAFTLEDQFSTVNAVVTLLIA